MVLNSTILFFITLALYNVIYLYYHYFFIDMIKKKKYDSKIEKLKHLKGNLSVDSQKKYISLNQFKNEQVLGSYKLFSFVLLVFIIIINLRLLRTEPIMILGYQVGAFSMFVLYIIFGQTFKLLFKILKLEV